jgi:chromosome segregation ATPase
LQDVSELSEFIEQLKKERETTESEHKLELSKKTSQLADLEEKWKEEVLKLRAKESEVRQCRLAIESAENICNQLSTGERDKIAVINEAKHQIAILTEKVAKGQKELREKEDASMELLDTITAQEREIRGLRGEREQLSDQVKTLEKRLSQEVLQCDEYEQKLKTVEREKRELQSELELASLDKANESRLRKLYEELSGENLEIKNKLRENESVMKSLAIEYKKLEAVESQNRELSKEIARMGIQLQANESDCSQLRKVAEKNEVGNENLSRKVASLLSELADVIQERDRLSQEANRSKSTLGELESELAKVRRLLSRAADERENLERKFKEVMEQLKLVGYESGERQIALEKLQEELEIKKRYAQKLEAKLGDLDAELNRLSLGNREYERLLHEQKLQYDSLNRRFDGQLLDIDGLTAKVAKTQERLKESEHELKATREESLVLKGLLRQAEEENHRLKSVVRELEPLKALKVELERVQEEEARKGGDMLLIQAEVNQMKSLVEELQRQLLRQDSEVQELQKEKSWLHDQHRFAAERLEEANKELARLERKKKPEEEYTGQRIVQVEILNNQLVSALQELANYKEKYGDHLSLSSQLTDKLNDQEYKASSVKQLKEEREELDRKLSRLQLVEYENLQLKQRIEMLRSEGQENKADLNELRQEHKITRADNEAQLKEILTLTSKLGEAQREVAYLSNTLQVSAEMQEKYKELKKQRNEQLEELNRAKLVQEKTISEISELRSAHEELTASKQRVDMELAKAMEFSNMAKDECKNLIRKQKELERTAETLAGELSKCEEKKRKYKELNLAKDIELRQLLSQVDSLSDYQRSMEGDKKRGSKALSDNKKLAAYCIEVEQKLKTAEESRIRESTELGRLTVQHTKFQQEYEMFRAMYNECQKENSSIKEEREQLLQRCHSAEIVLDDKRNELDRKAELIAKLEMKLLLTLHELDRVTRPKNTLC